MSKKQARLIELKDEIQQLETQLARLRHKSDRYTNIRLASFILGALISGATLIFFGPWPWVIVSVVILTPFVAAVYYHGQVERNILWNELRLKLNQTHVARMALTWADIPLTKPAPPNSEHPFAYDLDLLGQSSLHQLVDTAVSREGSQRLLDWLLDIHPDPHRIAARQTRVQELVDLSSFRDELIMNASQMKSESGEKWPGQRMLDWLESETNTSSLRPVLFALMPLSLLNIILGILNAIGVLPPWWVAPWLVYVAISFTQARKISHLFLDAFFLRDGLEKLGQVFSFLETYSYDESQHLRSLCRPFLVRGKRPSEALKRVTRVVAAVGLQKNPILWFWVNALIPWDITFAHQLNQAKRELKTLLPAWLDVWFELEALSSLATFAYLNPEAVFPEILSPEVAGNSISFAAQAMGHPLISDEERICNDLSVDTLGVIYMITGSNMAGKSTFLRTLGINLALAYAGGPVIADRLRTSMFRLYTAIKVTDSVIDGFSYFYAEVRRLKALLMELDDTQEYPLFFLIDEIFRGTNNRERLIGSRAFIRALAGGNGIGAIATHDLELVKLEGEMPDIRNFHFRDDVQNGRMVFDYKLHEGPCPTTNALKIMRLAGLPVSDDMV